MPDLISAWSVWTGMPFGIEKGGEQCYNCEMAMETALDLCQAGKEKKVQVIKVPARWKPPDSGTLKINTDASFNKDSHNGATGLVVRNQEGILLRAQSLWHDHAASANALEAEAVREGVRMAIDMGIQKVIIETDALEVVNLCNHSASSRSIIASVCLDIRELSS